MYRSFSLIESILDRDIDGHNLFTILANNDLFQQGSFTNEVIGFTQLFL